MNTLLFVMVACLFFHTFLNSLLDVCAKVVSKAAPTIQQATYSVEELFSKVLAGLFNFFKHL